MKTLLLLLISFGLSTSLSFAQDYYVLHINGTIKDIKSQRNLMVGDVIHSDTELVFFESTAKAIVISKEKGRMLLDGSKAKDNRHGEFEALLTQVIMPVAADLNMSSRRLAEVPNEDIKDIGGYFGENQRVIFGDEYTLHLDKEVFKKKGGSTYIYRYEINNQAINKVLKIYDGELLLNKAALYPIDQYDVPEHGSAVEIYITNVISKKSEKIASFKVCFLNEKMLYREVQTLIKVLDIKGKDDAILEEVDKYVQGTYGEPFEGELKSWLIKRKIIPATVDLK
ncbi:hypothetical protein [Flammeovirga sp. EKP202]|uniref:hypothetical protein n=1 Tax=Flammeovirga sp. EKP202 TaxID=2770592 RepID=UPI00165F2C74|nr:hypothetical protein [Flammeovirga sp. EKP202]MBD0403412.1 hypothetical protein [Flammeovirga sp. EKP202]